jgi:hypothetical protein
MRRTLITHNSKSQKRGLRWDFLRTSKNSWSGKIMDVINILLGAVIALVSSVITTNIVIRYQRIDAERKRKWEIEDRTHLEKRQIILKRIDQIEEFAVNLAKAALEIQFRIQKIHERKRLENSDYSKVGPFFENGLVLGLIMSLDLPIDVGEKFGDLLLMWQNLFHLRNRMEGNLSQEKILDNEAIYKEAMQIRIEKSFGIIIARLDELRKSV